MLTNAFVTAHFLTSASLHASSLNRYFPADLQMAFARLSPIIYREVLITKKEKCANFIFLDWIKHFKNSSSENHIDPSFTLSDCFV